MHATTILDQHITPEQSAAESQRAQDEGKRCVDHQRAIADGRRKYEADLRVWTATRPEFALFIKGIRNEKSDEELTLLAVAAGVDPGNICTFRGARRRALGLREEATRHGAAKKELSQLEREFLALEKQLAGATVYSETERLETELQLRADALGAARRRASETRMADEVVEAAKRDGLI
ncbi:MAG: hypothetical protein L6306_10245 [Planctomycetales bacterium]|nr:hypothetical protein [Planctomycetales bacterium]